MNRHQNVNAVKLDDPSLRIKGFWCIIDGLLASSMPELRAFLSQRKSANDLSS